MEYKEIKHKMFVYKTICDWLEEKGLKTFILYFDKTRFKKFLKENADLSGECINDMHVLQAYCEYKYERGQYIKKEFEIITQLPKKIIRLTRKYNGVGKDRKEWTNEEEQRLLYLLSQKMSVSEISKVLGRSVSAIYRRIFVLKNNKN